MNDAECAETNEISILRLLVFEIRLFTHFYAENWSFSINFHYNFKNINRKNLKYDFSIDSA